jgi:gamma-glutamylcyclotransferase (GGCT)/AIG2-like uncharacterized protein YtfP
LVARYFAYGSNMNLERVRQRGMRFERAMAGRFHGVRLEFHKTSRVHAGVGHASLAFAPGGVVEGVLYELAGADEIFAMDRFESAPVNYSREIVQIQTEEGALAGWTYFANPAVIVPGLKPPRSYLEHLLAGRPFLSDPYFRMLESWECADDR